MAFFVSRKGKHKQLKLYKQSDTVLNAEGKFSQTRNVSPLSAELLQSVLVHPGLTQSGKRAIKCRNNKNFEVNKVRPFFQSSLEIYVDRFQLYPFDVSPVIDLYIYN